MRRLDRWNDTPARAAGEEALGQWVERQLGLPAPVMASPTRAAKFRLPISRVPDALIAELGRYLRPDQIARDAEARTRASFGGHFLDAIARRDGIAEGAPDAVVFPETAEQLSRLFNIADRFELRLRLRGAATAQEESQRGDEIDRPALAIDLTRYCKILRWDRRAGFVEVEAGARYADVESALAAHRYRLADPDGVFPWRQAPAATIGAAFACGAEPRALSVEMLSPAGTVRYSADGIAAERAAFLLQQSARGEAGAVSTVRLPIVPMERSETRLQFLFASWDDALAALRALSDARLVGVTAEGVSPEALSQRLAVAGRSLPTRVSSSSWLADVLGRLWRQSPYRAPALVTVALRGDSSILRDSSWRTRRLFASGGALLVPTAAIPRSMEGVDPQRLRSSLFSFRCLAETFQTRTSWVEAGALVDRASRALHARFDRDGLRGWIGWSARAGVHGVSLRASVVAPQLMAAEVAQYAGYRLAFERGSGEPRALPLTDGASLPVQRLHQLLAEAADPKGRLRKVGVPGGSRWRKLATEETRYWLEDAGGGHQEEAPMWAPDLPVPPPFPTRPEPRDA